MTGLGGIVINQVSLHGVEMDERPDDHVDVPDGVGQRYDPVRLKKNT